MTEAQLRTILLASLPDRILDLGGQILYSGIDTLARTESFYFLGFNPAQDGTNPMLRTLIQDDSQLGRKKWSAYTGQCWRCKGQCDPATCPRTGKEKHQKNVQRIMCELGLKPEETFATNLVFVESRNISGLKTDSRFDFETCLEACWLVHRELLAEIKPKFIVCLGNGKGEQQSAFGFLRGTAAVRPNSCHEEFAGERTLLFFASPSQRFDSGCSPFFHPVQLFVLHPISNGELARIQPLECGFIKRDKAPVLTQDVTGTGLPYQLRDGSLPPHF